MLGTSNRDDLLRLYVDGVFERYDLDRSNTLTLNQLVVFFNDLLLSRGLQQRMSLEQAQQSLRSMDTNSDGQITKMELFNALKKMNLESGLLQAGGNVSQVPSQLSNVSLQYPNFSNVITPTITVQQQVTKQQQTANLYAKPQQITNNFVMSQIIPANVSNNQYQIQKQQTILPQNQVVIQQVAPNALTYKEIRPMKNVIHTYQVRQPVIMTPPAVMSVPVMSPVYMPPPPMMPYGPMGMGYGPMGPMGFSPFGMGMGMGPMGMGMMGPGFGPMGMGMGPFGGMNPLAALFGGLFGF